MAAGLCSECDKPLKNPAAKTCSDTCRSRRSRRLKRRTKAATKTRMLPAEQREFSRVAQDRDSDELRGVLREELRPVVREAITEDTYRALQSLVSLTPRAVECIHEDLYSDDAAIRQRAYTMLMKYTIGHSAIVKPEDESKGGQMVVNFNLPRPGAEVEGADAAVELEAEELRTCDMCGTEKPVTAFVAASERCVDCYEKQRDLARSLMKGDAG